MKKQERERRKKELKKFLSEKRKWNFEHPKEALAKKEAFSQKTKNIIMRKQRLFEIKKEKKRLKAEQRKQRQPLDTPLLKLAKWLKLIS